ncbi:uncharacterized protein TRUGW13939_00389 [Talaromyces rugulosus]|uniref:FAD-binding PCMH-type domain-containing protein n=1 Tax=Talaromyces rugulosus TaxID=121627 RepID=A0A7H8QII7_TALRU|nr:uncharacterized protein TRUGW13939_00389 [Talaromyces rugulosus]QKX53311.1 hypothetical protein TRUGW13939_00389 [Talaromyces rugulosus]
MNSLDSLKRALRQEVQETGFSAKRTLSNTQYSAGFNILLQDSGWMTYQNFVIPQLCQLLTSFFKLRASISVLEIGPGPKSVIGYLPKHLRRIVRKYTAFEPNILFATKLDEWLRSETDSPLPCLTNLPDIHKIPFSGGDDIESGRNDERYDIILFCHSMYGLKPEHRFIQRALNMLVEQPRHGIVVVFHRDRPIQLGSMVCHRVASFPNGEVRVANRDGELDSFASFLAGFVMQDAIMDKDIQAKWRAVCRKLGYKKEFDPDHLFFGSPNIMVAFTQKADRLGEIMAHVPLTRDDRIVKNWEARLHCAASVLRPTEIAQVQKCVRWARGHNVSLTVLGGGHSGHCLWPHVVSVDMGSFDRVHVLAREEGQEQSSHLVVAEAGCKTGDIVRETMAAGVTVPLGSRPSVGAGLWLQGGLGHLSRLYGLTCDAIVGAVIVSTSSKVLCVGLVPDQLQPADAIRPENESDILWAIKGAGTNFGIVISVTFEGFAAPTYLCQSYVVSLSDHVDAQLKLGDFDKLLASQLPRNCSADAYLYWDAGKLRLSVTTLESHQSKCDFAPTTAITTPALAYLEQAGDPRFVNGVELFDTEMYMSTMHGGGHGGGKTSSFKRCIFLKHVGKAEVADILVTAIETRPTQLCYLHLLQGGGAIGDVAPKDTAFGCREWDFACVITSVWPREQTDIAPCAVQWVYNVAENLMSVSSGAYGADLGPDPRDIVLSTKAFGPNWQRLATLKQNLDPQNVLAYACPIPRLKLIVLVTGESGAGKDYCAEIWASEFIGYTQKTITACVISISDAIKREYAVATGADIKSLLWNRTYKEQHRPALTKFFQEKVRQQPRLPEQQFLNVVNNNTDVDVLLITGMRDEAPVAVFSHLYPDRRLVDVYVQTSEQTRRSRHAGNNNEDNDSGNTETRPNKTRLNYHPSFIFENEETGTRAAELFASNCLLPFFHEDLQKLDSMVRRVPNFPRVDIEFRHVLGISQQPDGLRLTTSLLRDQFSGDWGNIDTVACCEAGGFVFASPVALQAEVPLTLMRDAGKLPPPTISIVRRSSYISSYTIPNESIAKEKRIEMQPGMLSSGSRVVIVDDVLSTGETLCAMLQLLTKTGINIENIHIMVVAEFPIHKGRERLRQRGFGKVHIQSLLVFDGA